MRLLLENFELDENVIWHSLFHKWKQKLDFLSDFTPKSFKSFLVSVLMQKLFNDILMLQTSFKAFT